jgi:hypothetical protein
LWAATLPFKAPLLPMLLGRRRSACGSSNTPKVSFVCGFVVVAGEKGDCPTALWLLSFCSH